MIASTFGSDFNDTQLAELARRVGSHLLVTGRRFVAAESCTGGWIGKSVTDVAGSSAWFLGGAIVYSNELKQRMLGVSASTLAQHGAVSEAAVREMAAGALDRMGGDIAVAVSGVAGPSGATKDKPIGTIWIAWSRRAGAECEANAAQFCFSGDREQVRRQTVFHALGRILDL
jgi:nicotinamide-nucleotide amidase